MPELSDHKLEELISKLTSLAKRLEADQRAMPTVERTARKQKKDAHGILLALQRPTA